MRWDGSVIKESATAQGLSIIQLADRIGVSRQAVTDWIKGQIPKGLYLITLCDILSLDPDELFIRESDNDIQIPVYRSKRKLKVDSEQQEKMKELAGKYKKLFPASGPVKIQPIISVLEQTSKNARIIARQMRLMAGVPDNKPMDYHHIFHLLSLLDIYVIFCEFPVSKLYAFFTRIYNHRVVFVDIKTNVMDLIFPLLHETVHSILRDNKSMTIDDTEEDFCDIVASHAQFPDSYIGEIYSMIKGMEPGIQINSLKQYSLNNHHAICGVVKRIQETDSGFDLKYGPADTNLRKKFRSIYEILLGSDNVRQFINTYQELSPLFVNLVLDQAEHLAPRILGELFALENYLDMVSLKDELLQLKNLEVTEEHL